MWLRLLHKSMTNLLYIRIIDYESTNVRFLNIEFHIRWLHLYIKKLSISSTRSEFICKIQSSIFDHKVCHSEMLNIWIIYWCNVHLQTEFKYSDYSMRILNNSSVNNRSTPIMGWFLATVNNRSMSVIELALPTILSKLQFN